MADGQHYSIVFKLADGEHTASLFYTKRDDKKAMVWAKRTFGDMLLSIKASTLAEHAQLVEKNLSDNPSRVPLDELTNGQMNRVLSDPSLVNPEH